MDFTVLSALPPLPPLFNGGSTIAVSPLFNGGDLKSHESPAYSMNLRRMKQTIRRQVAFWVTNSVRLTQSTWERGTAAAEPDDPSEAMGQSLGELCWIACESPSTQPATERWHRAMLEVAEEIR